MPVNPLIVETLEERTLFSRAEGILSTPSANIEYNRIKKLDSKNKITQKPPTLEEAEAIHNMYLEQEQYSIFQLIINCSLRFTRHKTKRCGLHVRHNHQ